MADVPQMMLSSASEVPQMMLSSAVVPQMMLSRSNQVPQMMLSPSSVPQMMLSKSQRAPDDVVGVGAAPDDLGADALADNAELRQVRAPDDVVLGSVAQTMLFRSTVKSVPQMMLSKSKNFPFRPRERFDGRRCCCLG